MARGNDDLRPAGTPCSNCGGNLILDNILRETVCVQCGRRPGNYFADWPYKPETSSARALDTLDSGGKRGRAPRRLHPTGGRVQRGVSGSRYKIVALKSWTCAVAWGRQPRPRQFPCQWPDCYFERAGGPRESKSGIYCDTHSEEYRQAWAVEPPSWSQFAICAFAGALRIEYEVLRLRKGRNRAYVACARPTYVEAPRGMPPKTLKKMWMQIQQRFERETGLPLHMPSTEASMSEAA
ncbi:MAG: hypothetical protein L0177_02575 [Chloroflexi bacterium]|nr:hypothetical protein [Chloroflexota bacterium]